MKTIINALMLLAALCGCKQAESPLEPTTFQVITCPCGSNSVKRCDELNLAYELKNVKGKLYRGSADMVSNRITLDDVETIKIDDKILPNWKYWNSPIRLCNMPKELLMKPNGVPVLISCILHYVPAFKDQVPQTDGYPAELTSIELIK